jgi:hypothetical protein
MATPPRKKKPASKSGVDSGDFYIPPLPLAVARPRQSVAEDGCVLIGLLLPLLGLLYVDILETKNQVRQELVKVEKLRREIEKEKRDADRSK